MFLWAGGVVSLVGWLVLGWDGRYVPSPRAGIFWPVFRVNVLFTIVNLLL